MQLSSLLSAETVAARVQVASKKRLLELISEMLARSTIDLDARRVFQSLIGRERLGSTGLGNGVAIPHGRIADSTAAMGAFVQLEYPIDYEAIDQQPVDLVFALLVPMDSTQEHLEILSHLAELLSNAALCVRLRRARDSAELLKLLISLDRDEEK